MVKVRPKVLDQKKRFVSKSSKARRPDHRKNIFFTVKPSSAELDKISFKFKEMSDWLNKSLKYGETSLKKTFFYLICQRQSH